MKLKITFSTNSSFSYLIFYKSFFFKTLLDFISQDKMAVAELNLFFFALPSYGNLAANSFKIFSINQMKTSSCQGEKTASPPWILWQILAKKADE